MLMPLSTSESVQAFTKALVGNNYSDHTVKAYSTDIMQFLEWVEENRVDWNNPLRFSRIDIVEFMNHLASIKETGVTRVRKLAAIRKFFSFMQENNIIQGNPAETVKGAIREEKNPEVLFKNEYKALLYQALGNTRDYAILMVFLQTGIRVSELVNLRVGDIDLENKTLTVRQGKGKKDRSIPLEEQALKAIKDYKKERAGELIIEEDVFFLAKNGTSLDQRTVRYIVHKYLEQAGVKKKASVHTLRHTYGTHKVDKGMSIPTLKELLGHRKMETTYKYIHLAKTSLRQEQEATAL